MACEQPTVTGSDTSSFDPVVQLTRTT
jgi:hypothetical protein